MGDKSGQIAARDISEALLEVTGAALISGDFESFASVFHVPQQMATLAGPIYMETQEDMRRAFDEMHRILSAAEDVTLKREVAEARFVSSTRIESTHVAETWSDGALVNGPYPVFSVIEKIEGTWKVTRSEYVLEADSPQAIAISKADGSNVNNTSQGQSATAHQGGISD